MNEIDRLKKEIAELEHRAKDVPELEPGELCLVWDEGSLVGPAPRYVQGVGSGVAVVYQQASGSNIEAYDHVKEHPAHLHFYKHDGSADAPDMVVKDDLVLAISESGGVTVIPHSCQYWTKVRAYAIITNMADRMRHVAGVEEVW